MQDTESIAAIVNFLQKPTECSDTSKWILKLPYTTNSKGIKWVNSLSNILQSLLNFSSGNYTF